jgi:iron(III) transport system permease protein
VALVLGLVIGVPLCQPVVLLLADPDAWRSWGDAERLFALGRNTFYLVAGTLAVALPLGTCAAILLYRTDLPFRNTLRFLIILTLFVPLPLFTSGWQTVLGSGGWFSLPAWNQSREQDPAFSSRGNVWTPWGQGIGSAVWIHAVAGLPWVILIVGQGLSWVERELEEDALTVAGPWRVLWHVTLPRAAASLGVAALWVGLQTATEITVTDVMQLRTFAEEVYNQFVAPEPSGDHGGGAVARACAVTLPIVLLSAALLVGMVAAWERRLPPRENLTQPALLFRLAKARWVCWALLLALGVTMVAIPLGSLVWRAGLHNAPREWSPRIVVQHLKAVSDLELPRLVRSLVVALAAGTICAGLGLTACWVALGSRRFRYGVLVLMAVAWAMPGPIVGVGLKATIEQILDVTGSTVLKHLLYSGPSSAPVLWVDLIRFFPCAAVVIWPVIRLLPAELRDQARVDGALPVQELLRVVLPLTLVACLRAGLAVAVLSLGELSAGKLVNTPGAETYATEVFSQMHYGVTNDLAARCLWLLAAVAVGGLLVAGSGWFRSPNDPIYSTSSPARTPYR